MTDSSKIQSKSLGHLPRWPKLFLLLALVYSGWLAWLAYIAWINVQSGNQ